LVWNRLCEADRDLCLAAGYPSVHVSLPVSDLMLHAKLGRDRAWALEQIGRVVTPLAEAGRRVSLGAEDASRADPTFLAEVFVRAEQAGVQRVRYADTLGILTPRRVAREVGALVEVLSVPLDFHGHNDFGLATANTLAAADAGARVLSCSLLGLGERAGNAALEEVYAGLTLLEHPEELADPRLAALVALAQEAAFLAGVAVPCHKPLAGAEVHSHQSGIHVDGLLKDPRTYEAWPPETLGGQRRFRVGKHSGTAALRHWACLRGASIGDEEARVFLEALRSDMGDRPGIDPEEALNAFLALPRRSP
jgi:homocitrate synthase NifV